MSYLIRRMTNADLGQVVAIDRASFSLPWPEKSYRFEVNENPAARCWVAETSGRIVGALVLWLLVDEVHIATIAAHPEDRRKGIARSLMLHALAEAVGEGATTARLEVRAGNAAAQELYRRLGFTESARRSGYYKDNAEDAVLMENGDLGSTMRVLITEAR